MDVSWPIAGSASLAVCSALALLAWWLKRRASRFDELKEEYTKRLEDLTCAEEEWRSAVLNGTPAHVLKARRDVERIRRELRRLKSAMSSLCVLLLCAGCATREPKERVVVVSDHAQIVEPGAVVPAYPAGESRWWLVTPTGMEIMVPEFKREF